MISHKTTANPHVFTCPIIHMLMVELESIQLKMLNPLFMLKLYK